MRRLNKNRFAFTPDDKAGLLFVLPFVIGFIWFFFLPLMDSVVYTFNRIKVGPDGLEMTWIGLENWDTALLRDAAFFKSLIGQFSSALVEILVIIFVSMFLALLLNDEFPGRLFFRTVLFLPVIFMSDRFITIFNTMLGSNGGMGETSNSFLTVSSEMTGFVSEIIKSFGFLSEYIEKFTAYATKFFDLVWGMGIQTIIFIIGLKSIPAYLYEVADMEGATKWETFWKITFPLLTPSILLAFVFTVVDHFNSYNNEIIVSIKEIMLTRIDYAVTQSWLYAVLVFIMVGAGAAIISRKIVKLD